MTTFFPDTILSTLLDDLETFDSISGDDTATTLQCAERTATALQELNEYLHTAQFVQQDQEIRIFKEIKPQIEGRLIFYLRLLPIQQLVPQSGEKQRLTFFGRQAEKIQQWLHRHKEAYLYYKIGATYLDSCYFVRQDNVPVIGSHAIRIATDRRLQTLKSYQFALFWAAELLLQFFKQQLEQTSVDKKKGAASDSAPIITWTGTQADATELIYALNEMGVLSGKRHEIMTLKLWFEKTFHANLGNIYKTYEHNRLRKKSRTPFLDNAHMALMRRYDHDDEHAL